MSLRSPQHHHEGTATTSKKDFRLPADVDWHMLDKSKFFILGAGLFSGVTAMLYPIVVIKTRQQVCPEGLPSLSIARQVLASEGLRGLYKGFGTSLLGTLPARALYMSALEITRSSTRAAALQLGLTDAAAAAVASAAGGVSAAVAAQLAWTPVDVISQRLMVQGSAAAAASTADVASYRNGLDAFRKIVKSEGCKGLYRGFGMSVLTYAPSNAVWWASYCITQRSIWSALGYAAAAGSVTEPPASAVVCVQGVAACAAGGAAALVTTPLDTVKTRMQVLDGDRPPSITRTIKGLVLQGGWRACYRGLGPRWASMSMSATTMIITYEFIKRMSAKPQQVEVATA